MKFLGIEIGGTKLQLVAGSSDARILERIRVDIKADDGAEGIRASILREWENLRTRFEFSAIGVGFGGPVDVTNGCVAASHQVAGWDGFELRAWLERETGLPVQVENDSNVAALAEAIHGAGRGFNPVFYTNAGSGVGGGLVAGGKIFHGVPPGEAEIGHVLVDDAGTTVESLCSGWAVNRRVTEAAGGHPGSELAALITRFPGREAAALGEALARRCDAARQVLNGIARDFTKGLSHAVHLFHPEVVVLGGGLSLIGAEWENAIRDVLPELLMPAFRPGPEIRLSALQDDVVPVGALMIAAAAVRGAAPSRLSTATRTREWIAGYVDRQRSLLERMPLDSLQDVLGVFERAWYEDRQIFVFGNGGSASNASHFSTDLGKGSSDALGKRFRVLSLNDNTSWMTALGNDYAYEDVFLRQLQNYARPGDVALTMSVSGNSPNLVKAFEWCRENGVTTIAMVGGRRGRLAEISSHVLVVPDEHYGRAEDAHMTLCHILCYAFMELTALR